MFTSGLFTDWFWKLKILISWNSHPKSLGCLQKMMINHINVLPTSVRTAVNGKDLKEKLDFFLKMN